MKILENISLADHTTFRIGGLARFFIYIKSLEDLREALAFKKKQNIALFILGGGSNILIDDKGFDGLVLKIEIKGIQSVDVVDTNNQLGNQYVEMVAGAGENWDDFVGFCVEKNLGGIENLSYIPGTVGASPVQNIGAYGSEAKDTINWVEAINAETGEIKKFSNQECAFSYRNSFFKTEEGKKYIISRVSFLLSKNQKINTTYKDISAYIEKNNIINPTISDVRTIVTDIRKNKLPDIKELGTAGSFFKNPVIERTQYQNLLKEYPLLPKFEVDADHVKIPAAWVLDNICGFKGYKEGNVGVYNNQALVLVNFGGAYSKEIKVLAQKMIDAVKEKISVTLEREVLYI